MVKKRVSFLEETLNKGAKSVAKFLIKQKEEGKIDLDLEKINSSAVAGGTILAAAGAVGVIGIFASDDEDDNTDALLKEEIETKKLVDEEMKRVEKQHRKEEVKLAMYMDAFGSVGENLKSMNDKNGSTDDLVKEWTADYERIKTHKDELERHDSDINRKGSYTDIMSSRRNQVKIYGDKISELMNGIDDYIEYGVDDFVEEEYK